MKQQQRRVLGLAVQVALFSLVTQHASAQLAPPTTPPAGGRTGGRTRSTMIRSSKSIGWRRRSTSRVFRASSSASKRC